MPGPTVNDLHVDSVRSEMSVGFANDRKFYAGDAIAPIMSVDKRSDKYAIWDKADQMRIQFRQVATGDPAPLMTMSVSKSDYYCLHYKGKTFIADEERSNSKGEFELEQANIRFVNEQALLQREKLIADSLFVTGKWGTDSTPGTKWSAGSATPLADLETGMSAVQAAIGMEPTDLILGEDVWKTLKHHSDMTGRITGGSTTDNPARVMPEHLAALIGVKRVTIAAAVYNTASAGASASMGRLYATNDALLVYRPDTPSKFVPSGAYTMSWAEFDNVTAEAAAIKTWRTDDPDGEMFRGQMALDPKLVTSSAGYFFSAATS